jgi:NitT/TauT family transport system substrate-binding protein
MRKYTVSDECIGCRACVEVAENNFDMNDDNMAFLKKQPETEKEIELCNEALEVCPVDAISFDEISDSDVPEPVVAGSNIKETLDKYPELKQVLIELSPKFKRMQNVALYNTLARFANFNDAAKITGLSVCEILHTINKFLGTESALLQKMPECLEKYQETIDSESVSIDWEESKERYIYNNIIIEELVTKISELGSQENIVVLSIDKPNELLKVAKGLGFKFNLEQHREYRLSIFNPATEKDKAIPWQERKDEFEILDVRAMTTDPFDIIIKRAYEIPEDSGFVLVQRFEPHPMINMLAEMGFEHLTVPKGYNEFWIYFHKKQLSEEDKAAAGDKVDAVIQSATPVAYPVIMRLLQSERIRKSINIKELKVWEETEKHLAWITNGKADISFSALITAAKLKSYDIKIPALFVWDNFVLLTRYEAKGFEDIKGKDVYTPLFEEAPPAKITKYLIQASGLNPDEYNFVYGKPFGRPEEIYKDFVIGKAETVILREPEASYAIKIMQDRGEHISVISFNKIWNEINPGFGSFPNAGLVVKGEFMRQYPEQSRIFLEELKSAIDWVNAHRTEAAKLSFDMMRQPVDRIRLFLKRVNFDYVSGDKLIEKVKQYFDILNEQEIVDIKIDDEFINIFKIDKELETIAEMKTEEQKPRKNDKVIPEIPVLKPKKKEQLSPVTIKFTNK